MHAADSPRVCRVPDAHVDLDSAKTVEYIEDYEWDGTKYTVASLLASAECGAWSKPQTTPKGLPVGEQVEPR